MRTAILQMLTGFLDSDGVPVTEDVGVDFDDLFERIEKIEQWIDRQEQAEQRERQ